MPLSDWTIEILGVTVQSPTLDHSEVALTNGKRVIKDVIAVNGSEDFGAKVRLKIAEIEAADARRVALQPGVVDVTPPVVQPPEPPTAEQQAKAAALRNKVILAGYQQDIALGIRKSDDPAYVALVATLSKAVDDGVLDVAAAASAAVAVVGV